MNKQLETFLLYYDAWHEGEFSFQEFKESLLIELDGIDNLKAVLVEFKPLRGNYRTYWDFNKSR